MTALRRPLAIAALAGLLSACTASPDPSPDPEATWWKGNLHTHSLWSDGDDFPESITDWYKRNGYHFLAISDHNTLQVGERWVKLPPGRAATDTAYARYVARFGAEWVEERRVNDTLQVRLRTLEEYRPLLEEAGRFLVIQSEEISARFEAKSLHMNATNLAEPIAPRGGGSVLEVLQNNLNAVLEQRARTGRPILPHLNHPNFTWAVTAEEVAALEGENFFEVYNGHRQVYNEGSAYVPSTEKIWDIVLATRLSAGRPPMYGLAVDDSHHYHATQAVANPGRGWIMVRAAELTPASLISALERGEFYATTGVRLRDYSRTGRTVRVEIEPEAGVTYTTRFIGTRRGFDPRTETLRDSAGVERGRRYSDEVGAVLAEVTGPVATYTLRGDELYVRATVLSSRTKPNGYQPGERETAWTQPWVTP